MLDALSKVRPVQVDTISVRTPRLYHFDQNTSTQIMEDLTDTIDLKTVLELPEVSEVLPSSRSMAIGHALGAWLRWFHSWASEPGQSGLREALNSNAAMREVRYEISYGSFTNVVQKFPDIWEVNKQTLEEVKDMATNEYERKPQRSAEKGWGVIHGDFWSGK